MKILVTGANGYLGKLLVELLNKNHEIIGLDKSYQKSVSNIVKCDLTNETQVHACFKKYGNINLVIHLAALAGVEKDITQYNSYLENNVKGSQILLEKMRENKVNKILFGSSCACYGNNQNAKEWDDLKPESFYGLSKVMGEELVKFYGRNHGFSYNIFRIFNVIGRGGESDFNNKRLIPTLINNINSGTDINLFLQSNKKETCVRDFVDINFVCEVFDGFINKQTNKIINIGSGQGISGEEMANKMFKLLDKKVNINKVKKRTGDPDRSVSNNEILEKAGFKYNKSIEEIAKQ